MLSRMLRIHEEFCSDPLVNCTKLVKILEVCRKTVVRDIAFMRDRLDLPIEFDPRIQAYRYAYPVDSFPGATAASVKTISGLRQSVAARDRYIAYLTRSLAEAYAFPGAKKFTPAWIEYGRQLRRQVNSGADDTATPVFLRSEILPFARAS